MSYLALFKARFLALIQYRTAAVAGLATQVFWGIIKVMILEAFYLYSTSQEPLTLSQAVTFIWLGQALLQLLPWTVDKEIEAEVRNGDVAYQLVRPIDLYGLWFVRSLSLRCTPTLMRFIPFYIIAVTFFGLSWPVSTTAGALFAISLLFSALLSAAMSAFVLITLFWTLSGDGIQRLIPHMTMLLSGMVVPLPLFPDWMQPFLLAQPFRGIIDIPCRFYTGVIPTSDALYYLGFQLGWFLLFFLCGRALLKIAMKKLEIQGG